MTIHTQQKGTVMWDKLAISLLPYGGVNVMEVFGNTKLNK
jgi:hypothetical protein